MFEMKLEQHDKAIILRKKGHSLREISDALKVSKSTVSVWVRDTILSKEAQIILQGKITKGQFIAAQNKRAKSERILQDFFNSNFHLIEHLKIDSSIIKIFLAIMYWCEGGKYNNKMIQFTNSDALVISSFMKLLRQTYNIKENKLRACVHLHSYHNEDKQLEYWSKITDIPVNQFIKSFKKENSGKRIRPNYQGCLQIRYHDSEIGRDLLMTGKAFFTKYGSLG